MMGKHILITGGAGFIGSHLCDALLADGHQVRILDNLSEQVHPQGRPDYLDQDVEFIEADVRDADAWAKALEGIDVVYHLAAAVGVGQSMYQISHYTSVNEVGTARLLEALIDRPVDRLVVASSMSLYGEGLYRGADGQLIERIERTPEQLHRGQFELVDQAERPLQPVPTPETKQPSLASVYALTKYDQERLCLMVGRAYDIPAVALRFFNVYGARQALSNPYTGVLAIFGSRYLNDKPPLIFEDGRQRRDFVHVSDVARGCKLAMQRDEAVGEVFNSGSGQSYSVRQVAQKMGRAMGKEHIPPEITGEYRGGDIRHCFADISKARRLLGYQPRVEFDQGLDELADWMADQPAHDHVGRAWRELTARGLTKGAE